MRHSIPPNIWQQEQWDDQYNSIGTNDDDTAELHDIPVRMRSRAGREPGTSSMAEGSRRVITGTREVSGTDDDPATTHGLNDVNKDSELSIQFTDNLAKLCSCIFTLRRRAK